MRGKGGWEGERESEKEEGKLVRRRGGKEGRKR